MREKYNAHLSSLKLRLDEGRVILVIIREEIRRKEEGGGRKWGFPSYNAVKQTRTKTAFLFLTVAKVF